MSVTKCFKAALPAKLHFSIKAVFLNLFKTQTIFRPW